MRVLAKGSAIVALGSALLCLLAALVVSAQESEVAASALETRARAEAAAVDLADALRSVAGSLRPAASLDGDVALTKEDNDRLIESAAKEQLAQMADELDALSAALTSGSGSEATRSWLQRLQGRAATLTELGRRTSRPVIPTEEMQALIELWRDVKALSFLEAVPSAELAVERDTP